MKKRVTPILFLITSLFVLFLPACDVRVREEAIRQKDSVLNKREADLVVRERALAEAEAKLRKTKRKIDSVSRTDSSAYYQPLLAGDWLVKMTCTETTCSISAIGDTRTEQWALSYRGYQLLARATVKNNFIRSYQGFVFENRLELDEQKDSTRESQGVTMKVRLQLSDSTSLTGEREIVHENNCRVVYALQLKKIN